MLKRCAKKAKSCLYTRILLGNKKECCTKISSIMKESWKHVMWKEPVTEDQSWYNSIIWSVQNRIIYRDRKYNSSCLGLGLGWQMNKKTMSGYSAVCLVGDENVVKWYYGYGCTTVNVLKIIYFCTLVCELYGMWIT